MIQSSSVYRFCVILVWEIVMFTSLSNFQTCPSCHDSLSTDASVDLFSSSNNLDANSKLFR